MLISEQYRAQQKTLHDAGNYGTVAEHFAPMVAEVINRLEVTHLLDYGCGSNLSLPKALAKAGSVKHKFKYQAYDPCVEKYSAPPVPAEFVVCIDVLEHIEEDCIDSVLDHLQEMTEAVGFFSVDTGPAMKSLPDGRNAHILQRPVEWWLMRICARFDLQTFQMVWKSQKDFYHNKFFVIVNAMPGVIEGTDGTRIQ